MTARILRKCSIFVLSRPKCHRADVDLKQKSAGRNFLPALERRWDSTRPLEDLANKVYPLPGKTL
jgi:hypothetical protein